MKIKKFFLFACTLLALTICAQTTHAEFFSDIIVTSPDALWTDSRAYSTLQDAIDAVGSDERTIVVAKTEVCTDLTIPSNVHLKFLRGGSIANSGQLTINTTDIDAGNYQIFTGAGDIDFASGSVIKSSWFSSLQSALSLTSDDTLTLTIDKAATITTNSSVGSNVTLKWPSSNIITVDAGFTLSNIKNAIAGNYQIFAGSGDFDFASGATLNSAWFEHLKTAIDYIGSDSVNLVVSTTESLDADRTVSANTNLTVLNGGLIAPDSGVTLTINGPFSAGLYQVFSGDGSVVFSNPTEASLVWWNLAVDGVTDNRAILDAAISALPDGSTLNFPHSETIAINTTWTIQAKNHLTIDFNHSTLKYLGGIAGRVLVIDKCTHLSLIDPKIDGNDIATDGLLLYSSDGVSCSFNEIVCPVIHGCTNVGLRFGDYSDSGNDYAVDRTSIYDARIYQNLYNIMLDSLNALDIAFYGRTTLSRENLDTATSPKYDVYALRGGALFYELYTSGAMRDDRDSWVFYIKDAYLRVLGGYGENSAGSGNCGYIFMANQTDDVKTNNPKSLYKSSFYSFNMRGRGTSSDPVAPNNCMIYMENDSRDLLLVGCAVYKHAYAGQNEVLVRVHENANFTSINNSYGGSPDVPWRGITNGSPLGRVISIGDRSTKDYSTWKDIPTYGYETYVAIDNSDHTTSGVGEQDLASTTLPEGMLNNRGGLRIRAAGFHSGTNGTKTVKFYFGTNAITVHSADNNQLSWTLEVIVFNTAVNTQRITWFLNRNDGTVQNGYGNAMVDTTSSVIVKLTGECADAADSIMQKMWIVERLN